MGFRWNANKNLSPIAIDFGAYSIKMLQVTRDATPSIVGAVGVEVPSEARKSPEAQHRFVGETLRDVLHDGPFKGKRVVASISAAATYTQHLRLHKGEGDALTQQIENELRGRLPLDPSMLVIRHVPVGEVFSDGASKQEIICMATARDYVMRLVHQVRSCGFDLVGMHCEPMSIMQSFAHLFRRESDAHRTTMFIDIGAATTKAMIAHGKNLVFAKTIQVGGEHFDRQLAEHMKVSIEEARKMRIEGQSPLAPQAPDPGVRTTNDQGMPMIDTLIPPPMGAPGQRTSPGKQPVRAGERRGALSTQPAVEASADLFHRPDQGEMLEALTDELHLCIGYHDSIFHDRRIDKAVFVGGEARHTYTCQSIARALRLPAQLGDPIARLARAATPEGNRGVDLSQAQPGWAVPVGLCLLPTNL